MVKKPCVTHTGTTTKSDIVDALYNEIGYSKKYSSELVDFCFDVIKKKLASNHNVKISNFGNFLLKDKKERLGRNPTTGKDITIPSRRVITFRVSHLLRKRVQ